jgi:hypothetical protein
MLPVRIPLAPPQHILAIARDGWHAASYAALALSAQSAQRPTISQTVSPGHSTNARCHWCSAIVYRDSWYQIVESRDGFVMESAGISCLQSLGLGVGSQHLVAALPPRWFLLGSKTRPAAEYQQKDFRSPIRCDPVLGACVAQVQHY